VPVAADDGVLVAGEVVQPEQELSRLLLRAVEVAAGVVRWPFATSRGGRHRSTCTRQGAGATPVPRQSPQGMLSARWGSG
jgi:hypothetical protein